jgi:hypothetical protein
MSIPELRAFDSAGKLLSPTMQEDFPEAMEPQNQAYVLLNDQNCLAGFMIVDPPHRKLHFIATVEVQRKKGVASALFSLVRRDPRFPWQCMSISDAGAHFARKHGLLDTGPAGERLQKAQRNGISEEKLMKRDFLSIQQAVSDITKYAPDAKLKMLFPMGGNQQRPYFQISRDETPVLLQYNLAAFVLAYTAPDFFGPFSAQTYDAFLSKTKFGKEKFQCPATVKECQKIVPPPEI